MSFPNDSGRMDWETPVELFDALDEEFGFTLDVCASAENAKVERFFTEADDGLAQDWGRETCWMNPPYGRDVYQWMEKAQAAAKAGATVVALVFARTDTRWWHDFVWDGEAHKPRDGVEVRFLCGRLRFGQGGVFDNPAPAPSCVVVFDMSLGVRVTIVDERRSLRVRRST